MEGAWKLAGRQDREVIAKLLGADATTDWPLEEVKAPLSSMSSRATSSRFRMGFSTLFLLAIKVSETRTALTIGRGTCRRP
jgi:hypothetical protein